MKNKFKFWFWTIIAFLAFFTIVIPVIYYTFNKKGYGWAHVWDVIHDKYGDPTKTRVSEFFQPW